MWSLQGPKRAGLSAAQVSGGTKTAARSRAPIARCTCSADPRRPFLAAVFPLAAGFQAANRGSAPGKTLSTSPVAHLLPPPRALCGERRRRGTVLRERGRTPRGGRAAASPRGCCVSGGAARPGGGRRGAAGSALPAGPGGAAAAGGGGSAAAQGPRRAAVGPRRAAGEVLRGAAGTGGGGERGGRHPRAAAAPELGRPRVLSEGFGRTGGAAVCGGSRSPRRCPPSAPRLLETRAPELGCARSAGLRLSHVAAERISRFRSGKRNATRAAGCSPAGSAEPRSRQRPRQRQRQPRAGTAPPRGSAAAGGLREAPDGREKLGCSARLPCPDVPFVPLIFARVTAPMDACGVN